MRSALCNVHTDHLNTPRLVADANQATVWKWDQIEPFGNNAADENPGGLGAFDLPLRLPGQRYDAETAVHYNYFRDYDPSLGIYKQGDPIGLRAGLNTYAYADNSPLAIADPMGLMGFGPSGSSGGYSRFRRSPGNPLPGYNYCGPGNRVGPPTSCVDLACKTHDECYDRCGTRAALRWVPHFFSACALACDRDFLLDVVSCKVSELCGWK